MVLLGIFLVACLARCNRAGKRRFALAHDSSQTPVMSPVPRPSTGRQTDAPAAPAAAGNTPVAPSSSTLAVAAPVGLSHEQMAEVVRGKVMQATRASRDHFEDTGIRLARAQHDLVQFLPQTKIADRVEYVMRAKRAVAPGPASAGGGDAAAAPAAAAAAELDGTDEVVTAVEQVCKDRRALEQALHQAQANCVQAAANYEADFVTQRAHYMSGALTAATQVR